MNLVEAVRGAGVIGAGGAGFPTHIKLQAKPELILINGAECEPLLRVDQELTAVFAQELVAGLKVVLAATGAKEGIFALKNKYHQANAALQEALEKAAQSNSNLRIALLGDYYPAGDEHILVYETTGRAIPAGGIPPEVGVTVLNVETLLNLAGALHGQPVIRKYVTVTGAVTRPATFAVPLGTTFGDLIRLSGGATTAKYGVLAGGPLMGKIGAPDNVVSKTTKGIIVLPEHHLCLITRQVTLQAQVRRARAACCNCRFCTDLCPRYLLGHPLEPHHSLNVMAYGLAPSSVHNPQAYLCSECGVCDVYACPMGLSPRQLHIEMKRQLAAAGIANPFKNSLVKPRREREWRRIPSGRMLARLNLTAYNAPAPLIEVNFQPERVIIPLKQGAGSPSISLVKPGDIVNRAQLLAEPQPGKLGSTLHASITGQVIRVDHEIEIKA